MFRFTTLTMSVLLLCLVAVSAQAEPIIEVIVMPEGVIEYERTFTQDYDHSSQVSIWMENVEDPLRWKEWRIEIWQLTGAQPLTTILVDYDNSQDPGGDPGPLDVFDVTLADADPASSPWPGLLTVGSYADTWEAQWEGDGTVPVGETGLHPWGNPKWVSFHFELPDGPWGLHIYDECIPEPATLGLLLLGGLGLALFRYRRSA